MLFSKDKHIGVCFPFCVHFPSLVVINNRIAKLLSLSRNDWISELSKLDSHNLSFKSQVS